MQDETGNRYGRLTVAYEWTPRQLPNGKNQRRVFCLCDCGNSKVCTLAKIRHGHTQSCGCLALEVRTKHGCVQKGRPGSMERKTYYAWLDIKGRCYNPRVAQFKNYGARGIIMHAPWVDSFEQFLNDVGLCPSAGMSIGRIDNDGNYEPGNVRWETNAQQAFNKRSTRFLEFNGEIKSLTLWAHQYGLKPILVTTRLRSGWTVEEALTLPLVPRNRRNLPRAKVA